MIQTHNLQLEKYELDDAANLADGYNNSMDKLDEFAGEQANRFPIKSEDIGDGEVNTVDIANGAVTDNKLATAAVTTDKIANGAVTSEKLSDNINNTLTDVATNKTLVEEHVNYFAELGVTDEQSATDLHTQIDNTYQGVMSNTQRIDDLEQHSSSNISKLGWIGDSFSEPSTLAFNWPNLVRQNLGITDGDFINNSMSGAGYIGATGTRTFKQQLELIYSQMPDVDSIVVFGGNNDFGHVGSSLDLAINNFWTAYKQYFGTKKAHVFLTNMTGGSMSNVISYIKSVKKALDTNNVNYVLHDVLTLQFDMQGYLSQTNLHPSQDMCYVYADAFTSMINGGEYVQPIITRKLPTTEGIEINGDYFIYKGIIHFCFNYIKFTQEHTVGNQIKIAENYIQGCSNTISVQASIGFNNTQNIFAVTNWSTLNVVMYLQSGSNVPADTVLFTSGCVINGLKE